MAKLPSIPNIDSRIPEDVRRILSPIKQILDRAMQAEGGAPRENRHGIFGGLTPSQRATLAQEHPDDYEERRQPVVRIERPSHEGQGLPADDTRHGTRNGYDHYGCRCGLCTNAAVEAVRKSRSLKKDGLPPGDPRHGTANGYENKGCRCDACKEAVRIKRAERRRAAKEAA